MLALRVILHHDVYYKSRRRLATGAVLLGVALVSGLYAGFHDESWQIGANNLLYPMDYVWTGMADVAANSMLLPHAYAQTPDVGAFITTWNVTGLPTTPSFNSAEVKFSIGVESGGEVHIDWGDGDTDTYNMTGEPRHGYRNNNPGTLASTTISITGDLERFYFHYVDPVTTTDTPGLLLSIDQWGDTRWSNMKYMFRGATNMQHEASDAPDLSAQPAVLSMFSSTHTFDDDLSDWDVSEMTSLRYMFDRAHAFNGDISGWDVSKVTDMTYMFSDASNFNGDLSDWDVSKVTRMTQMFPHATSFNGDISDWDVSSVEDMHGMFTGASSFARNLAGWDVSSVEDMSNMFNSASAFNADVSGWNVSSVSDAYEMSSMFRGATAFNRNLGPWFITLEDTLIENREALVTDISSQVEFDTDIDGYDITGTDAGDFTISGGQLLLNSASDYSSKSIYDITITANTTNVRSLGLNVEPSVSASIRVMSASGADPTFSYATYDTGTGILNVTFSEPMSDTVNLAKMHVRDSDQSSGGVTLTGAASQSVSGSSLAVTLSASQQSTVGGMIAPQLDIDADAVSDAAGNGITAVADRPITINDTIRPSFDSAAYVSSTGILALTFDEPISSRSFPSKIHIRESGQSSGGITLTGAAWTTSGSTVKFFLEPSHKSGIAALGTQQLDIDPGAISDVAGNKIARTADRQITINDTTLPTFDSSTYDEDSGILRITFSEPIYDLATDLSKIHIRDYGQSSGGVTLTGAADQPVSVGTLTVRLSASQQSTVNAMSTPQLDIDEGAVADTADNEIAAAADRPISLIGGTAIVTDTVLPTFDSATYSTETNNLIVTFSEPISSTVDLSKMHIRESGQTSGGVTLTGTPTVASSNLTVTLSSLQRNTVNAMSTPQLDIDEGAVADTADNEIAAAADRPISLIGGTAIVTDTVLPTFDSATYSTETNNLIVTFSEPISSTVDLSKMHIRESGQTSGGVTLTGTPTVAGSNLTVTLSSLQRNTVNAMSTPQLDIDEGAVADTADNEIAAAADRPISLIGGTAIVTDTVLPTFDSATYSTETNNLIVTFSEPISSTVDLSKMHIRESGQTSGGVTLTGTPTVASSNLTVTLSSLQRNTVNAMSTPQLDIDEGAVADTADNEIAAAADRPISLIGGTAIVTDTVLPTFDSATYSTETNNLIVTFSEPISSTVDLSKMHIRESGQTSGGVTLTGTPTVAGSNLTVTLSSLQRNTVNAMSTPQLDIDEGAVADTADNEIAAAADRPISLIGGTAIVTDTVLPTFDSATYSTETNNLIVTFSEPISSTVDLSKMHIRESGQTSGGVTLTGTPTVASSNLTVTLSSLQRNTVNAMSTPQLDIDEGAVADTADNEIAAAADLHITVTYDIAGPVLTSAAYNTGTGILNITFSVSLHPNIDLGKMYVHEAGQSTGDFTLEGVGWSGIQYSHIMRLTPVQKNIINAMSTPQLDIDEGAVRDWLGESNAETINYPIDVTDGIAPVFVSATYNTGTGVLDMTFSEPISDNVTFSGLHIRESNQTSGGVTLTDASSQSVSSSTLTVTLSASQRDTANAIVGTPQLDIDEGAVTDTSNNQIVASTDNLISVTDGIAPVFVSAQYTTGSGILNMTFSEPISDNVTLSGLHVRESGQSSGGVTLTDASSQSVSGSTLAVTLSASQRDTANALGTLQLDIDAGAVSDTSDNPIATTADLPVTVMDTILPVLDSAAYHIITGILNMTFSEPISDTVTLSGLHVRESGLSSGGVTLTDASSQSVSGSTLTVTLSASQRDTANALGTMQLDIDADAVLDAASNGIAADADRPILVTDGAAPVFSAATYSTGTGVLNATFSEPISAAVNLSKLHIRESGQTSGGATLTGVTFLSVSGNTLTVTLSTLQKNTVNAMTTPQLDIDAGAVSDTYSSRIAATADQPITVKYTIPPVFDSATYHTLTGILNMTFSEPISTTIELSKLHVRESGQTSGGVNMTDVSSQSVSNSTFVVWLSPSQRDTVNAMTTPQLDIDAGAVSDTSDNPIEAAADQPIAVTDGTPPNLSSAAYSTISGDLRVAFNEPISTTIELSKLHVRESGQTSGGATLTGVTFLSASGNTLTVTLPPVQKNTVNAMTTPQLDIDAGAVSDTSDNPIEAAADQPITINDTILPVFDSATYHTLTGILNMTFSEPISTPAELSKLHIRESGQTSGGVNMTDASSQSVSGNTLVVTLSPSKRDAVNALGTPQLDIDAGAVLDTSANPIAAVADQPISVTDGTPPVFSAATYNARTGILNMTFNEPISDTVTLSGLHVRESGQTSGGVNMTDASSQSVSGNTLVVTLSPSKRDAVNALGTPQLDIDAGAVLDTSANPIETAAGLYINQVPTADAGQDQTVSELVPAVLDGTGSFDNDGAILTYLWNHTSGPSVTLNATDIPSPTFTSPQVTSNQEVVFTLTVTDDGSSRDQDTVTIFIDDDSIPPALASIVVQTALGESFIADTIVFRVTFSEDVTGVDSRDFEMSGTGTGSVSSVAPVFGSGAIYDVIVDVGAGGTFGLDLRSSGHDIRDKANNLLTDNVPETDSVYTVSPTSDHEFTSRNYPPTVRLVGSHNINNGPDITDSTKVDPYVELGGVYVDKGATCYDLKRHADGSFPVYIDISSRVTVDTSQVDTSRTGLSEVIYSCTDDDGITTTSRIILVLDRSPPVITTPAPAFSTTLPRTTSGIYYVGDFGTPTAFDFSVIDGRTLKYTYTGTMNGVPIPIPKKPDLSNLDSPVFLTGFREGTTVLTWTVSDIHGNKVTTMQNVTINVVD